MSSTESSNLSPKIFASYAWSEERSAMVREVCERLKADHVDVLLDQWHLKEGDDDYHFMEKSVNDPTVTAVLLFCDKLYAKKANSRTAGVGAESQMISPEVYESFSNSRVIPLICERDEHGKEYRPHFVKSRFYIDFSSEELINANWEQLIRRIYGKPQFKEPPSGPVPSYILEPERQPRQSVGKFLHWQQTAAKNGALLSIAERDYLTALLADLKALYWQQRSEGKDAYELLPAELNSAKVMRDELLELFAVNAAQTSGHTGSGRIGSILDRLLALRSFDPAAGNRPAVGSEALNLFLYELFLYTITQLVASEDYHVAGNLLDRPYATGNHYYQGQNFPTFATFYTDSKILEDYNSRQQQHYRDYQSVVLSKRCSLELLSLDLLVQADVLLAVRAIVKNDEQWYPRMLYFRDRSPILPLFAQAQRKQGFENLAVLVGTRDSEELADGFARRIEDGQHPLSHWQHTATVSKVIDLDNITGK